MTRSPLALEPGLLIAGRYRLLRPLGSGGSADVWAAEDEALGREVAVKALSGSIAQGGREGDRLRREARLLALLHHPRITTVYDFVEAEGPDRTSSPVMVTELIQGVDLGSRLKQGPLPAQAALTVCAEVAEALAAAHGAGIVHRDVKPGNVMLTKDGAKLLDFGISRRASDSDLTGPVVIGTPACIAPEQWRGESARPAADVYALGCLLFWCLSGHAPYSDRELPALGMAHLLDEPPALPAHTIEGSATADTAATGATIAELYRACMSKEADERPSALEVARVLRSGGAEALVAPAVISPASPISQPWAPRTPQTPQTPVTDDTGRPGPRALRPRLTAVAIAAAAVIGTGIAIPLALAGTGGAGDSLKGNNSAPALSASHSTTRLPGAVDGGTDGTGGTGMGVAADVRSPRSTLASSPKGIPSPPASPGPGAGPGPGTGTGPGAGPTGAPTGPGGQPSSQGGGPTAVTGGPSQPPAPTPSQPGDPGTSSATPSSVAAGDPTQQQTPGGAPD